MAKRKHSRKPIAAGKPSRRAAGPVVGLRIIGGQFRGRRLAYSGDPRTRPMKDRLREAVFNLVGPSVRGAHVVDLFAGTGALAFEALSRGASRATLIEQHRPTAEIISRNAAALGVEQQAEIVAGDTFRWFHRRPALGSVPWLVFCSPPYDFYVERAGEMLELLAGMIDSAPAESIFVVEADARFDFQQLSDPSGWMVRLYPPAVVGIYRKRG